MHYSTVILLATLAAQTTAHGVVTEIQGANGVNMPGLSAPSQVLKLIRLSSATASSAVKGPALSARTQGGGPVDAAAAIANFMGNGNSTTGATAGKRHQRGLLESLLGGGTGGGAATAAAADAAADGTKAQKGAAENGVSKAAGAGASSGLPTCSDDGTISVTYHQANQDGAGPLTADIDPTSGSTDPAAFQQAAVTQDVPGIALGLSATTTTDFPVKVQMPEGMTCSGQVGGAQNVCVARIRNSTPAGPFGGSVAFTQSSATKKRAVEYNLRKRHFARGTLGKL